MFAKSAVGGQAQLARAGGAQHLSGCQPVARRCIAKDKRQVIRTAWAEDTRERWNIQGRDSKSQEACQREKMLNAANLGD